MIINVIWMTNATVVGIYYYVNSYGSFFVHEFFWDSILKIGIIQIKESSENSQTSKFIVSTSYNMYLPIFSVNIYFYRR